MDTPDKVGRYEILEELGRGAMGVVYRAKDPAMGRVVAVKTIISVALAGPHSGEFRERFFREARTAGALAHPGIVSMFDVGEHEGNPYLVMEFIQGPTLGEFARSRERLSPDRICEIGAQLAEALGYAHQRGVVHRDIKPANILMTSGEAHGIERPKITDFGVAKLAEQHTTMTGKMVGTPAYMPPEQFTGAPIDGRSDIFSLGVLLYWMATGEQPFPGETITSVSYKVVNTDPAPPRRLNPAIPARLDSIILKCMAKSPDERYQQAQDLARELSEVRQPRMQQTGAVTVGAPEAIDPDATLLDGPMSPTRPGVATTVAMDAPAVAQAATAHGSAAAPRTGARNPLVAIVGAGVAAAVLVGWFLMRSPQQPAQEAAIVAPPPEVQPQATAVTERVAASNLKPTDGASNPPASTAPSATSSAAKPAAAAADAARTEDSRKSAAEAPKVEASPAPAVVAAPAPPPKALPVDFDPKSLDRRANARVEFDVSRMPANLDFTVEMNNRIYYEKAGPAAYKKAGDLYVPPGVHEFRVVAHSGAVEKASNTVSTDFRPNKRSTLKIELRIQGKPAEAGMPAGLYPDSQLVLTLK